MYSTNNFLTMPSLLDRSSPVFQAANHEAGLPRRASFQLHDQYLYNPCKIAPRSFQESYDIAQTKSMQPDSPVLVNQRTCSTTIQRLGTVTLTIQASWSSCVHAVKMFENLPKLSQGRGIFTFNFRHGCAQRELFCQRLANPTVVSKSIPQWKSIDNVLHNNPNASL